MSHLQHIQADHRPLFRKRSSVRGIVIGQRTRALLYSTGVDPVGRFAADAGLCERWDALQERWNRSMQSSEHVDLHDTRKRVRFLERIQSHISSVLGSEQDCRSSVHSQMQEPLLCKGKRLMSCMAPV